MFVNSRAETSGAEREGLKQTWLPVRPVVTPAPWWNLHKSGIFHGQAFQRPTIPRPQTTVVSVVKPVKRIKTRHLFIGSHPTKPGNEHSACKVVERSLLTIPQSLSRASPALSCRILLGVRVPPPSSSTTWLERE